MELSVQLYINDSVDITVLPAGLQQSSADTRHFIVEQFGISDARQLIAEAHQKAVAGSVRHFIVAASSITTEAQNALLKLFEEPPSGTALYVLIPDESLLIPTLRSRFVDAVHLSSQGSSNRSVAEEFLKASYAKRLELIAARVKEKDQAWMNELILAINGQLQKSDSRQSERLLKALLLSESYLTIRGASKKMLLEELALSLPRPHS